MAKFGSVPPEALSEGAVNDTIPADQRAAKAPTEEKLSMGPKVGAKGEYQPASYKTHRGNVRTDR